jgi:hypothetical protein
MLRWRQGAAVPVPAFDVADMSEVLVASLNRLGYLDGPPAGGPHPPASPSPKKGGTRAMSMSHRDREERSLEEAWADALIAQHPRVARALDKERLGDLAESWGPPTVETVVPVIDIVREFELARRTGQIMAMDDARLAEAVIYRVSRHLFANEEERARSATASASAPTPSWTSAPPSSSSAT